jgi:hypothetical protein
MVFASGIIEGTIEFWFKAPTRAAYSSNSHIFSLYEDRNKKNYMEIFIQDGALNCAPFGITADDQPII